jgi:hypothetical protein
LQIDHIVVTYPVELLQKLIGQFFLKYSNSNEDLGIFYLDLILEIFLGIILFAKLLILVIEKPPEYFTHVFHIFPRVNSHDLVKSTLYSCPCAKLSIPSYPKFF